MDMTIRGLVYSKYNSIGDFAADIGWKRNKASRIVNMRQPPSKKDMEDMIVTLEIPETHVAPVFFGTLFTP